jgi:hypothetical protein
MRLLCWHATRVSLGDVMVSAGGAECNYPILTSLVSSSIVMPLPLLRLSCLWLVVRLHDTGRERE